MSALKKLETGVPGLDTLTLGGIPEGRSTLITGKSGTGKTVIGLQIASNLARQGIVTIVVAVEESPEDLQDTGDALNLGTSRLVRQGPLYFADITRPMDGPTLVSGEYDLFGLVHRLEALTKQTGARAVVIDSATALFSPKPPIESLRSHFFQLVYGLRKLGLTAIILAEAPADYGQLTTMGVEDYVCDLTIILRNIVDGGRRRRSIEVNKYRRSAHYKGEFPCTITTRGLAVFPLDAKEPQDSAHVERYSSGVTGLDEMTHGGWLRNSIIIVRGPTGSGKTLLAGLYARAGAQRNERVVYYGFEETRPILLRNYREIGMTMDEYIEKGNLKVICRYPEATSLEDLLVDLRLGLEELKPSLVIIDSISSIEHASSEKGFRQFMIGVAAILREHGRSALITQTIATSELAEHTAPYLSTIADAILTLDYSTESYELDRQMRVIKMRGSDHEQHPYRLTIEPGGLKVKKLTPEEVTAQKRRERFANR
ncbi:MAG TPA: circadian clock protein KaiC [Vicinamibacterales bacterium]|nr:circadian clock protein KaiC [Vicinamibacterales bacterium]